MDRLCPARRRPVPFQKLISALGVLYLSAATASSGIPIDA